MAKWWLVGPLQTAKRGITSLFVCTVVLLPLILIGWQLKSYLGVSDGRKETPLAALQVRPVDATKTALKPFSEPLITVTFDDGWETIYSQAGPLLQKHGIPTTEYILSGVEADPSYMSFDQLRQFRKAGHEIGCHTVDHKDLTTLSQSAALKELVDCKTTLEKELKTPIKEFASPFGASNSNTIALINENYRSHRNTDGDIITNKADDQDINTRPSFNPYAIIGVTLRSDTTVAQLQAAIDYTVKNNGWLVLNYHQVGDDDGSSKFAVNDALFEAQLQALSKSPARIVTVGQFMDAYQKAGK